MSNYAIGDIQGCREQLEALLDTIQFDATRDILWLAGDLVNRGPDSLGTLRLLYSIRSNLRIVLGNHDLHMLAAYYYPQYATIKDSFSDVLAATDAEPLIDWLRSQPLLQESDEYVMSHAGIYPFWTLSEARCYATEAASAYQALDPSPYFQSMYGNNPELWEATLTGVERLRFITNAFTRMRFCDARGALKMQYKATIAEAPAGLIPWFELVNTEWDNKTVLFGHWAALDSKYPATNLICLDTGCVWGNQLSAYCLETQQWFHVDGIDKLGNND